jgi:ATP-dependent Lon protease
METARLPFALSDPLPVLPIRNMVLFPSTSSTLVVGRPKSIAAVKRAQKAGDLIVVVAQRDGDTNEPGPSDLQTVGVVCLITKANETQHKGFQIIASSLFRFRVNEFVSLDPCLMARGEQWPDTAPLSLTRTEALATEIKKLGLKILGMLGPSAGESAVKILSALDTPEKIADFCCSFLARPTAVKQGWLEDRDLDHRLNALLDEFIVERERISLQSEIQSRVMARASKDQRDHFLREQLRVIHEELGDEQGKEDWAPRIEAARMSADAEKVARSEAARLGHVPRSSPEYQVIRTYLEWLTGLPWKNATAKPFQVSQARAVLDADHFGLEKVKTRIGQFLAVRKLRSDLRGPVLCFVGPPGVGKTSLGRSIAKALGREFIRASLGGVRDEAEIRGHRRTYVGALPGRIIQSLKRCGSNDPVMLLDEIDKVGTDFRGDPASALLEVLDPEQNGSFIDHYLDVPFDLSSIFFITTANSLDTIPRALLDRLEVIEVSGYSLAEKTEIAVRHLVPRLLREHGMTPERVKIPRTTIEHIVTDYTLESGVRGLSRQLAQVLRGTAEQLTSDDPPRSIDCSPDSLDAFLGPRKFFPEQLEEAARPGVVTGLAWTPTGGQILHVEATQMEGKGDLILTGQLGDVMKESAQIALSLLRSQWHRDFPLRLEKTDTHIHFPAGAIPKDGPSAGAALYLALASLVERRGIDSRIAVTGEITLRGQILPVGGIKEKVLAAHRAGVRLVILPRLNAGDLREVPAEVRAELRFHFVKDAKELAVVAGLLGEPPEIPLPPSSYRTGIQSEFVLSN